MKSYKRWHDSTVDILVIVDNSNYYIGTIYDRFFRPYSDLELRGKSASDLQTTTTLWEF